MSIKDKEQRFRKPSIQEAIEYLKEYVHEVMSWVEDDIEILTTEEAQDRLGADIQVAKLINHWNKLQRETALCSFKLSAPAKTEFKWRMIDPTATHISKAVEGNDLRQILRATCQYIEDHRIETPGSSTPYTMPSPEDFPDLDPQPTETYE